SLEIPPSFDDWNELLLYPRADYERYFPDKKWETLELQRIVVTLGVMNENYTPNSEPAEAGVAFDAVDWSTVDTPTPTSVEVAGARYYQPASFQLYQNYPNPFNPATTISFALLQTAEVRVQVYDLAGRLVATLQDGRMNAGTYAINWTPQEEAASGVYLLKFTANEFVRTKKMVLMR
ncbi:T9SS type A sorting domain-containing protein, partial [candidate division KSB1 bacterium]|nr:T9SS type A sorting domain-containing protein [candidate division KSB1 bacterium]